MINLKTITGTVILLIAAQQLLVANEYYRTGKLSISPLSVAFVFIMVVALGIFLIIKGIKSNSTN
jgi:hypothetical protein